VLKLPSRSRQSPTAKYILVHFSSEFLHLLITARSAAETCQKSMGETNSISSFLFLMGQSYWHPHQPKLWRGCVSSVHVLDLYSVVLVGIEKGHQTCDKQCTNGLSNENDH